MRNLYYLCVIILFFSFNPLKAQLSGTYTIGGTSPNYATVIEAVDSLNKKGVSGAVTFNIRSGTYNGQFTIKNVSGASATNTILFRPDPANTGSVTVQYNGTSTTDNYAIRFESAKYIEIDSISIGNLSTTFGIGRVIEFKDTCDHITLKGNTIQGRSISSTSNTYAVIFDDRGTNQQANNITIEGNNILNGSYAIHTYGASSASTLQQDGWKIKNNSITNWYNYGIYSLNHKNIEVEGNTIVSANFPYFFAYGAYFSANNFLDFRKNSITQNSTSNGYGIYMTRCNGSISNRQDISNNMIYGRSLSYGFYITSCSFSDVFFNTIKVDQMANTNGASVYLNLTGNSNFENNNVVNLGGGNALNSINPTVVENYNNLYSNTGSSSNQTMGANSISVDPMFLGTTNLHIENVKLNGKARSITGITTDIDGDTRNTNTDIGADEFNPDTLDASALKIKDTYCVGTNNLEFEVLNFGLDTIKTMRIIWGISINGRPFQYQPAYNYTGSIVSGDEVTINLASYNIQADTTYRLTARIDSVNGKKDNKATNDAFTTGNFTSALNGTYTIGGNNPSFNSFTDAVAALNASGICGPVTFKVRSGTYNQAISFSLIKGISATDTVLFTADTGTTVPVLYTASFNTVTFSGTREITFRNLAIHNNNRNGNVVTLSGNCKYIRIDSCELRADTANFRNWQNTVILNDRNSPLAHFELTNSNLRGGNYSINFNGDFSTRDTGATILNNRIWDWGGYGVYAAYQHNLFIEDNDIKDADFTGFGRYGIYVFSAYTTIIKSNRIVLASARNGNGMYLYSVDGRSAGTKARVYNNMVSAYAPLNTINQLFYCRFSRYIDINYNSFYLESQNNNATTAYAQSSGQFTFRNNIVYGNHPGTAYFRTGTIASTHNNVVSVGGTTSNTPLGGTDVSVNPFFLSRDDLHAKSIFMDKKGVQLLGYNDDFDGDVRQNPSDIGADEFEPDSNDVGIVRLLTPVSGHCGVDSQLVKVLILNNGYKSQSSIPINVQVFGSQFSNLTTTYTKTLTSAKYDTVDVGYINTKAGGRYTFYIYSSLANDSYRENDTLLVQDLIVDRIPSFTTQNNIVACDGIDTILRAGTNAKTIKWYDALTNGNLLHEGDSFKVNLTSKDTFYVSASDDYRSKLGQSDPFILPNSITTFMNQGLSFDAVRPLVIDSLTVYPVDSGTLVLTLLDRNNQQLATKSITVLPQQGSKVAVGFSIAPGKDYRLTANGTQTNGLQFNYSPRYPYIDEDSSMYITGNLNGSTGIYHFFYDFKITVDGCDAGFTAIPVDVRPTPPLNLGNDTGYCTGTTINLNLNATSTGGTTYLWENGSPLTTRNITTRGDYSVTVTGSNGCVIADTIKVSEIPQPTMSWIDRRYCSNEGTVKLHSALKAGGTYTGTGIVNGKYFNTGVGPGTYALNYTYSDGMGCFGQTSGNVYVDTFPKVTQQSLPDVCQGPTRLKLTGGSPSTGYYYDNENLIGFGDYWPKNSGLDTIYYVGFNSRGCKDTVMTTITVKPAPNVSFTTIDSICENGSAVSLTATPAGGIFSGTGVAGTQFDPTISGAGNYTVYYEAWFANGCTTKVGNKIEVLAKPAVTFNALLDVCEKTGDYTITRGKPLGGILSGSFVDDATNTFDVDNAGVGTHPVTYKYTDDNQCSNEVVQNLVIKPAPVVNLGGDKQICGSHTVTLDAGNSGALYLWSTTATAQKIVVSRGGNFSVRVNLNGCVATDSVAVSYEAICVGLAESNTLENVKVYPNPTDQFIEIDYSDLNTTEPVGVKLFDARGKLIATQELVLGQDHLRLDVSNLNSGLYVLNIESLDVTRKVRVSILH